MPSQSELDCIVFFVYEYGGCVCLYGCDSFNLIRLEYCDFKVL